MLPEPTSLDGVVAGSVASVEGSGVYVGDSRNRGEHRGGPVGEKEGVRFRDQKWEARKGR